MNVVNTSPNDDPERAMSLGIFGNVLQHQFVRTGVIHYLNKQLQPRKMSSTLRQNIRLVMSFAGGSSLMI